MIGWLVVRLGDALKGVAAKTSALTATKASGVYRAKAGSSPSRESLRINRRTPKKLSGRFGVGLRVAMQQGHGEIGADEGAGGGESYVHPVSGVTDYGEGGEKIPDAAPTGRGKAATRGDGGVEEDVDGVGCGGGDEYACC